MVNKVMVTTDGSEQAKKAIELGADIASKYDATLFLVHAIQEAKIAKETKELMEAEHMEEKSKRVYLDQIGGRIINEAKNDVLNRGVRKTESAILLGKHPAREITDFAKENSIDMIVIGHNGVGKLEELYNRRIAKKVLRRTDCTCIRVD